MGASPASRALGLAGLVVVALATACARDAREPIEIDLTALGLTLADGEPEPFVRETSAGYRRLVEPPGARLDLFVRVPRDARLRFTLDPRTPADAFAVAARSGTSDRALAPRRTGEGDWEAALDGFDDGAIVRLRLENGGTNPLAWWAPRLTGTVRPRPPVLAASLRPPPGPLNLIVVLSDALRADHLGLYGYRRPTTPELARLAGAHGVVFERAYAAGPSTPNSIPTLFTSRYPSALGINFQAHPGGTDRTLAEAFSLGGARTAAFVANPLLLTQLGYARGFGAYEILRPAGPRPRYPRAATLVDRAIEYLSVNRDAPCFLYVHLMDTHNPYDPPPPHRGRFAGEGPPRPSQPRRTPEPMLPIPVAAPRPGPWLPPSLDDANTDPDSYDETILSVDEQIGRLIAALEPLGMRDRTVVVLTADHGEALGVEDDGSSLHGHALYEELAHVPLVVLLPWLAGERRIPDVVSLVDLAPTLVDLAGLPIPASFAGTSLFATRHTIDPPAALLERFDAPWALGKVLGAGSIVEWAMREGSWKLLLERHRARLYDLAGDPKETIDVKASHPDVAGYLAGRIGRLSPALGDGEQPSIGDAAGELERPLAEALKSLGYLSE